jgi:hypothetical protein
MCFDSSWTQCPDLVDTSLSSMCCMSYATCTPISNGTEMTTIVCCSDDQGCPTFAPISCNLQLQNNTANPTGQFKTTDFSPLEPCNGLCCPHGYACNGTMCLLDDGNQSAAPSSALTTNTLLSAALAKSSAITALTTNTPATSFPSRITPTPEASSAEFPTSVAIDTSQLLRSFSSQAVQSSTASSLLTGNGAPLPTTQSSSSGTQRTQDQDYKKLIVPITVVAVAAWLLLVFAAWRILKRRKRKACEEKNPQEQFEKSEMPPKSAKKRSLRFELPGEHLI